MGILQQKDIVFHLSKASLVLALIGSLYYFPTYVRTLIAVNVLITIFISLNRGHYANVLVALLLGSSIFYVETKRHFIIWMSVYALWNIHFCIAVLQNITIYNAVGANILPWLITILSSADKFNNIIFVWTVARGICILMLYISSLGRIYPIPL